MSEVATSIASSAPSVSTAVGRGVASADIGNGGVGFSEEGPTFSGLGRMGGSVGSFSINEGSKGPVSFNNSTDLFAETKSLSPISPFSEGPAGKSSVLDSVIVAKAETPAVSIEPALSPAPEPITVFTDTTTFAAIEPVNEGPMARADLADTVAIAEAKIAGQEPQEIFDVAEKETFQISAEPIFDDASNDMSPESIAEAVQIAEPEIDADHDSIRGAIEDLKTDDPLAAIQLEADLRSVDKILDLVDQVTDQKTAAHISNVAIETAVERSGIIDAIAETSTSTESEAQGEPQHEEETQTQVQAQSKSLNIRTRNGDPETILDTERQLVRETPVDESRVDDMTKAITQAFEGKEEGDQIAGTEITAHMSTVPPSREQSGYAKMLGMEGDGTYTEFVGEMADKEYSHDEQETAIADAKDSAERHYAVTIGRYGEHADPKQAEEVRRGGVSKTGTIFLSSS